MTRPSTHCRYATLIVSVFVFSLTLLVGVVPTVAQTTGSATLRGTVKDPQGAIIRDAIVTLINERNKDERQTKSSEDGAYTFAAVAPGTYTIKTEVQGFKTRTQTGFAIETSDTKGLSVHLPARDLDNLWRDHGRCSTVPVQALNIPGEGLGHSR